MIENNFVESLSPCLLVSSSPCPYLCRPMVSINNLSYFVGGRALYDEASLFIKPKDKIGLIGLNGTGKTTLLRLIHGDLTPDSGDISFPKDCTLGFLNQDLLSYESDEPILNVAMEAFGEINDLKHKIDHALHQLEADYSDKWVEKLGKYQEKYEHLGGYSAQSAAEEVLEGIGFTTEQLQQPLRQFSGGWRMRVMLAKLLLQKPSLLMLDEPTNHLDLPSIEWVENYLKSYEGAVMVVSHDRNFLDNVIDTTVEVTDKQLIRYSGNYSFYRQEKELREEIRGNAFENQQKQIKQTERFIERFRSKSTKARQVQSRIKSLERMDKIEDSVDENPSISFNFTINQRSGKRVLDLNAIGKAYEDNRLFSNSNLHIARGDKIALVGANGKGKSTLLRIIAGTEPHEGEREIGHNVNFGFYAQHQLEALNVNQEILSELKLSGSGKTELELRNLLGCFLFSDDDVFKKIKVLSGGEKSRVALAKTLISQANFLLLDEPTNHLDFISENILIEALNQYEGTYVVVSHNRHFVTQVANKIWYIDEGMVKEYPGTFEEYLHWMRNRAMKSINTDTHSGKKDKPLKKDKAEKQDKLKNKAQNPSKREIEDLESKIMNLEDKISTVELKMGNPDLYKDQMRYEEIRKNYNSLKSELEKYSEQWESLVDNAKK